MIQKILSTSLTLLLCFSVLSPKKTENYLQPSSSFKPIKPSLEIRKPTVTWQTLMGKPFGERVRLIRKSMNHTLDSFAEAVGLFSGTISKLERGKGAYSNNESIDKVIRYLRGQGVKQNWLYGFTVSMDDLANRTLKEKIKILRKDLGWSRLQLADEAIVDEKTIFSLEELPEYLSTQLTKNKIISAFKTYGAPEYWFIDEITLTATDFVGMSFGEKVRLVRMNLVWEPSVLASEVGIDHTTVNRIESSDSDYQPSETMKQKLIDFFVSYGAEEAWFLDETRFQRIFEKAKKNKNQGVLTLEEKDLRGLPIGEKIQLLRANLGLTRRFVAEELSMGTFTVTQVEKDLKRFIVKPSTILKLIRFFERYQIPPEWLVEGLVFPGISRYKVRKLVDWLQEDYESLAQITELEIRTLKDVYKRGSGVVKSSIQEKMILAFEHFKAQFILDEEEVVLTKEFLEGRSFGQRIQLLRINLGWTVEELAVRTKGLISKGSILNIEKGRTQRLQKKKREALIHVFLSYGVTEDWFIDPLRQEDFQGETFKELVLFLCKKLDWSNPKLAKQARVSVAAIRNLGEKTSTPIKLKIIEAFQPYGVTQDWFADSEKEKTIKITKESLREKKLHERIRLIREAIGLTRSELAELSGLTKSKLNSMETRELKRAMITTFENLSKLMKVFSLYGVTSDWFEDLAVLQSEYFSTHMKPFLPSALFEIAI